jgi:colanic acid/amylovoran biosynthesis glycosyltransferase
MPSVKWQILEVPSTKHISATASPQKKGTVDFAGNVIIFRDHLLPYSETFVRNQAESLQKFVPYYFGSRVVPGISTPAERTLVLNRGGIQGKFAELLFKVLGVTNGLGSYLQKLDPKLIHAHFGSGGALALPLALKLRLPLVMTFHGSDAMASDEHSRKSHYSQRLYLRRRAVLQQKADLFLAVSEVVRQRLIDKGFPAGKTRVHQIGVDLDFFKPDTQIQRKPVVLFAGRLVANKGTEYLLRAMQKVQAAEPEVEVVILGDGVLRTELERLSRETCRHCHFLGSQPAAVVRDWMNRASVFCVPSITIDSGMSEGFGLVFAEAQAMGLPVVSFATGGIPEAVAHQTTGYLGPERDCEFLAAHITLLLKDSSLWSKFSAAGMAAATERFSLRRQTAVLEGMYDEVIRNKLLEGKRVPGPAVVHG